MRIVYGVQSTGKGHLSRFLALKPKFERDGHEILVIISGFDDPPAYFLQGLGHVHMERFPGLSMIEDGVGGISKRRTLKAFASHLPGLLESIYRAHGIITAFDPDLIVSDFEPITGSPLVAPGVYKVGIGNQPILHHPAVEHLQGMKMQRFNIRIVEKLFTSGVDVRLGSHFFPVDDSCLPPILRSDVLNAVPENRGHVLVYHAFSGHLASVVAYAGKHPQTRFVVYGQDEPLRDSPGNIHFEHDSDRFVADLVSCDTVIGTAGFQTICEAFYLGKKLVVQPIDGHYEQKWNAAEVERHGMGRWCRADLEPAMHQSFNQPLHEKLASWYREGTQRCYDRLLRLAEHALLADSRIERSS